MAALVLQDERVTVYPFSDNLQAMRDVLIATADTIWEDPKTGDPWMLIYHESLYFGDTSKDSLLCPDQMRAAGAMVNDTPKQFDPRPSHSILATNKVELPLSLHGVISSLPTRLPTQDEIARFEIGLLQSIPLTDGSPLGSILQRLCDARSHSTSCERNYSDFIQSLARYAKWGKAMTLINLSLSPSTNAVLQLLTGLKLL